MGENIGVAVFIGGMATFVGGVYVAMTGQVDDLFIWALGWELVKSILLWGFFIAIVIGAFLYWSGREPAGAHGHITYAAGNDRALAQLEKHENAHKKVTAAVGGGGSTVKIWAINGDPRNGYAGTCTFHDPGRVAKLEPEKKIAIDLAGLIAAPETTSPTDKPHAKAHAKEANNPSEAMRKGKQIARRHV
jgi:hypothetical protein